MKYELTDCTLFYQDKVLHRIVALDDIYDTPIKKGMMGGYIEKESNLTQNGSCWIFDNAKVYGGAIIRDDARVYADSHINGKAVISGSSVVTHSLICGGAQLVGTTIIDSTCNSAIIHNSYIHNSSIQQKCMLMRCDIYDSVLRKCGGVINVNLHNAIVNSGRDIIQINSVGLVDANVVAYKTNKGIFVCSDLYRNSLPAFAECMRERFTGRYSEEFEITIELIKHHFNMKEK